MSRASLSVDDRSQVIVDRRHRHPHLPISRGVSLDWRCCCVDTGACCSGLLDIKKYTLLFVGSAGLAGFWLGFSSCT